MSLCIKTDNGFDKIASLGGNVISGSEITHYKQEETVIGYWTDGKPLYRKVINTTSGPEPSAYTNIVELDSNCKIIDFDGYATYDSDVMHQSIPLNFENLTSESRLITTIGDSRNIIKSMYLGDYYKNIPIYITVEYTKTTDTPITNNNTYSTDEVLTGKTWIDGKPIYRKVVDFGDITLTVNTDTKINHNISNIDTLIDGKLLKNQILMNNQSWVYNDGSVDAFRVYFDKIKIILNTSVSGWTSIAHYIGILEYTKTTD